MKEFVISISLILIVSILGAQEVKSVYEDKIRLKSGVTEDAIISDIQNYFRDSLGHAITSIDTPIITDEILIRELGDTVKWFGWSWMPNLKVIKYSVTIHHEVHFENINNANRIVMIFKSLVHIKPSETIYSEEIIKSGKKFSRKKVIKRLKKEMLKMKNWI